MNATLQKTLATIRAAAGEQRGFADQVISPAKVKQRFLDAAADLDAAYKAVESCMAREGALLAEVDTQTHRLDVLAELLRNCPHALVTFNDDADHEDDFGMIPLGYSIRVKGEEEDLDVSAQTLGECIDRLKEQLQKNH